MTLYRSMRALKELPVYLKLGVVVLSFSMLSQSVRAQAADDTASLLAKAVDGYGQARDVEEYQAVVVTTSRVIDASDATEQQRAVARFLRGLSRGRMADSVETAAALLKGKDPSAHEAALKTACDYYLDMQADFSWLLAQLPPGQEVAALLKCIADIKLASFALPGEPLAGKAVTQKLLADALAAIERYLATEPAGLNRVRAEFFRGVVLFRRALPVGTGGSVDSLSLRKAYDSLKLLAEPSSVMYVGTILPAQTSVDTRDKWLSYVEFYLGLVQAQRALAQSGSKRGDLSADAKSHFARAIELDKAAGGGADFPPIVEKVERELSRPTQVAPINDLLLEWRTAFAYDSNVTIIGDHTALPRNISKKSDVRTLSNFSMNYSFNLESFLAPAEDENRKDEALREELRKWDISLAGRAGANWNGQIEQYNEQDYGSSVAVRREILPGSDGFGPVYAGLQHDYDYFLLGNDGFLSMNRVTPSLSFYSLDSRALTTLYFIYEDRDYEESLYDRRFNRDGNYFVFGASQWFDLVDMTQLYRNIGWEPWGLANDPKPYDPERAAADKSWDSTEYARWLRPYFSFETGWDSTRGDEFDDTHQRFTVGLYTPLPYGLMLTTHGDWEWQDYSHPSLVDYHRRAREDFIQRYGVGVERKFVLVPGAAVNRRTPVIDRVALIVRADMAFTCDDSNGVDRLKQSVFQYDRQVYGLSFTLQFN